MEYPDRAALSSLYEVGGETSATNTVQGILERRQSRTARAWRWLVSFLDGAIVESESSDAGTRRRSIDRRVWVAEEAVRAAKKHRDDDPERLVELFRETARLLCFEDRIVIIERRVSTLDPRLTLDARPGLIEVPEK